jgi:hypothetical protein
MKTRTARTGLKTTLAKIINSVLSGVGVRLVRTSTFTGQLAARAASAQHQITAIEDYLIDLLQLSLRPLDLKRVARLQIVTKHRVALRSADHLCPHGTKRDNTRHPRFVAKCEKIFGGKIFHLDLGCAGAVWCGTF